MAFWHDLIQRLLLQAIIVIVVFDSFALEALNPVDGAAQVVEHRVDHLGGKRLKYTPMIMSVLS